MAYSCGTLFDATPGVVSKVGSPIRTANLMEECFPSVEKTCKRVDYLVRQNRKAGIRVLKLIHGYASSGICEKLRIALRAHLSEQERSGEIRGFIRGEQFHQWDQQSRELLKRVPEIIVDNDFGRSNRGITLIVLE